MPGNDFYKATFKKSKTDLSGRRKAGWFVLSRLAVVY